MNSMPKKMIWRKRSDQRTNTSIPQNNIHHKNRQQRAEERGLQAEGVVLEYFIARGCIKAGYRKKLFGVEFDWIFKAPERWIYVEVKSVQAPEFYLNRWPTRQRQRFYRVARVLAEKQNAEFFLAFVDTQNQVHLFRVGSEIEIRSHSNFV